jgi:MarR family transcriptional regulator, organic hydroperoxide resistance regulator
VPGPFSTADRAAIARAEADVRQRAADVDVDALALFSNVFRLANAARNHLERTALAEADLSFSAFTTLWVLWVWGEHEARHLADAAGITKGTLTGVVDRLEARGLVQRRVHAEDRRLVLVRATRSGQALARRLLPKVDAEQRWMTDDLSEAEKRRLARHLRSVLARLEDGDRGADRTA